LLKQNGAYCIDCAESNSCEFSSDFCPRAAIELDVGEAIAIDPLFKKYKDYYKYSGF